MSEAGGTGVVEPSRVGTIQRIEPGPVRDTYRVRVTLPFNLSEGQRFSDGSAIIAMRDEPVDLVLTRATLGTLLPGDDISLGLVVARAQIEEQK